MFDWRHLSPFGALFFIACASHPHVDLNGYIEITPFADEARQKCAARFDSSQTVQLIEGALAIEPEDRTPYVGRNNLPPALREAISSQGARTLAGKYPPGSEAARATFEQELGVSPDSVRALEAFDDGWLTGFNRGEFGGSIWWFPKSGAPQFLAGDDPNQFIRRGEDVYVAAGLAHMLDNNGAIVRLFRTEVASLWKVERFVQLPRAAKAFAFFGNAIYVATHGGPMLIAENRVMVLDGRDNQDPFLHLTYPNSIVRAPDGSIYIGARYGVALYRNLPSSFDPKWIVPASCTDFVPRKFGVDCECLPADAASAKPPQK